MKRILSLSLLLVVCVFGYSQSTLIKSISVNDVGWKRIVSNSNSAGRGYGRIIILTQGGSSTPYECEIGWFKGWSDYGGINIIANTRGGYWSKCRITYDGVKSYVEVYFTQSVPVLQVVVDQKEWAGFSILDEPAPDGGGIVVLEAVIGRVNFGENDFLLTHSGNVGIGTSNPNYKLDVNGTIRACELKVDMQGADFVFEEDYQLRSLEEVEEFINANKHLPDVAPAKEMQKEGVKQSEMNQMLLQKIEELMLYVIFQNKKIEELENLINLNVK